MKFIGITGGVGAGKSQILSYLAERPDTKVLYADEIAHALMEPQTECYEEICRKFAGEDIFTGGAGTPFDRAKLARVIFAEEKKRAALNGIVHPAVKNYVKETAWKARCEGKLNFLVLEAALLIEEHYDEICDELWYIDAKEPLREERLMASRGYSRQKVRQIFASQLPESEYRRHCSVIIDNNGTVEDACRQIEEVLYKETGERRNE